MSAPLRAIPVLLAAALAAGVAGAAERPVLALGEEVARVAAAAFIVHSGDGTGRVFVGERGGRIVVFGGEIPRQRPFLDITSRVDARSGGLRAAAFPYDFADRRRVYVSYVGKGKDLVVVRFRLAERGEAADAATEQVLLRVPRAGGERPGGGLAFGPDGKLYVGVGDGTAVGKTGGEAQDLSSLRGKILRIDVDSTASLFGVPPDNPFARSPGARPEIWARGVGSPSSLSFDSRTGDLFFTDLPGARYDEVNVQPGKSMGGENYGWSVLDGNACQVRDACDRTGFTPPAASRSRREGCETSTAAVLGGGPYPGLEGEYLVAYGCSTRLTGIRRTAAGGWESRELLDAGIRISAIGTGENGVLFVADRRTGRVYEIRPASSAGDAR